MAWRRPTYALLWCIQFVAAVADGGSDALVMARIKSLSSRVQELTDENLRLRQQLMETPPAGRPDSSSMVASSAPVPTDRIRHGNATATKDRLSRLMANVQVASLADDGEGISMPQGTKHVLIEIGCSDRNTMDEEVLPADPGAFLISFEPLLDKYAVLLARGTLRQHNNSKDKAVQLAHHHPRGVVLPLAVTTDGEPLHFTVSSVAGCSSSLEVNPSTSYGRFCLDTLERRTVPSLSMTRVLGLAGGRPIKHVKIDAQGADFALVRSVPLSELQRVERWTLEVMADDCPSLYIGQPNCSDVVARFDRLGWRLAGCLRVGGGRKPFAFSQHVARRCVQKALRGCEVDFSFVNPGVPAAHAPTPKAPQPHAQPQPVHRGRDHPGHTG